MFGIQARGGCSCAGPYGHRLLGIDLDRSREFDEAIAHGCEGIKPGWTRVSFNYFISETVFDYIVEAVDLIATHGWRLLGEYRFELTSGLWRHRAGAVEPPIRLTSIGYDPATGDLLLPVLPHQRAPESALTTYLADARRILETSSETDEIQDSTPHLLPSLEHLRWFDLPPAHLGGD